MGLVLEDGYQKGLIDSAEQGPRKDDLMDAAVKEGSTVPEKT